MIFACGKTLKHKKTNKQKKYLKQTLKSLNYIITNIYTERRYYC